MGRASASALITAVPFDLLVVPPAAGDAEASVDEMENADDEEDEDDGSDDGMLDDGMLDDDDDALTSLPQR